MERVMGIEPMLLAWKAKVLPLNYTRENRSIFLNKMVEEEGFEPPKAEPLNLQSRPVDRLGNSSKIAFYFNSLTNVLSNNY
jgi:hypothetical protein